MKRHVLLLVATFTALSVQAQIFGPGGVIQDGGARSGGSTVTSQDASSADGEVQMAPQGGMGAYGAGMALLVVLVVVGLVLGLTVPGTVTAGPLDPDGVVDEQPAADTSTTTATARPIRSTAPAPM